MGQKQLGVACGSQGVAIVRRAATGYVARLDRLATVVAAATQPVTPNLTQVGMVFSCFFFRPIFVRFLDSFGTKWNFDSYFSFAYISEQSEEKKNSLHFFFVVF